VTLPKDSRSNATEPGVERAAIGGVSAADASPDAANVPVTPVGRRTIGLAGDAAPAHPAKMVDSSPSPSPHLNQHSSG